jgi:hypothetical protein
MISESGFDLRPRLLCGASPPAERRFHADKDVLHRPHRRGIRQKHVTLGRSEGLHSGLKLSVRGSKAFVASHELRRPTVRRFSRRASRQHQAKAYPSEPNGAISVGCKRELYRPSPEGRTLRPRESAARNDHDTARNVRRSAAHKALQPVRHPNASLHYLWRERGAVDRVEHVADERP